MKKEVKKFRDNMIDIAKRKYKKEDVIKPAYNLKALGLYEHSDGTISNTPEKKSKMRVFGKATRDLDEEKIDYEGFLSPIVLERYAQYMHKHRNTANGLRESDN